MPVHEAGADSILIADKDKSSGRVNAVWPGSALHYMDAIEDPRYEDFDITYHNKVRDSTLKSVKTSALTSQFVEEPICLSWSRIYSQRSRLDSQR